MPVSSPQIRFSLLSHTTFIGSKYPKSILFSFENTITGADKPGSLPPWRPGGAKQECPEATTPFTRKDVTAENITGGGRLHVSSGYGPRVGQRAKSPNRAAGSNDWSNVNVPDPMSQWSGHGPLDDLIGQVDDLHLIVASHLN